MMDITTSVFTMKSQRINLLKIAILSGVSLILLWIAFDFYKKSGMSSQSNETLINGKLINPTQNTFSRRDSIVSYGMELLGTPYVTAGSDKNGFDCSGFIYYVFKHFKIDVPRSSLLYKDFGKEVSIENVKKGDVLMFLSPTSNVIGHLGIVTNPNGMESEFIHSTSGREMKVVISSLKVEGYKRRFVKAISVIN